MSSSFKIAGADELYKALLALPDRLALNVFHGATLAGAGVLRDAMRRLAPVAEGPPLPAGVRPGDLRRAIKSGRSRGGSDAIAARAGLTGRWRKLGHLIEFGHDIRKNGGRAQAHPFARPAFDTSREASVNAFVGYCYGRIDAEVARLKSGS